jgi:hypothetical protein
MTYRTGHRGDTFRIFFGREGWMPQKASSVTQKRVRFFRQAAGSGAEVCKACDMNASGERSPSTTTSTLIANRKRRVRVRGHVRVFPTGRERDAFGLGGRTPSGLTSALALGLR